MNNTTIHTPGPWEAQQWSWHIGKRALNGALDLNYTIKTDVLAGLKEAYEAPPLHMQPLS